MRHRARKRFGQNFLVDKTALIHIAGVVGGVEKLLEIGPGKGALTRRMRQAGVEYIRAVELDRDLAEHIRLTLPTVDLVEGDALKLPMDELAPGEGWVCCANLPYNVGTPILLRLLPEHPRFLRLVLMFQKEVALRITAQAGSRSYGSLSVMCQAYSRCRVVLELPPAAFDPRPQVDSAVVEFRLRETPQLGGVPARHFEKVVRAGFSMRRKILENALTSAFDRAEVRVALAGTVGSRRRAEQLTLAEWGTLAAALRETT